MNDTKLALFRIPLCPYCMLVERHIRKLGLSVEILDISRNPDHLRELTEARGRKTTPVLRIERGGDTEYLPESRDIVAWLTQHAPELR